MVNSHVLSQEFEYIEPHTVQEAVKWITTFGGKAELMAGGTDLIVQMKMGRIDPKAIINLSRIPALRYLIRKDGLRIGVLTTFRQIEKDEHIRDHYTALHEAAKAVSSVQIKTMGTLGGNLCHASPAADSAPPLIAFGAAVKMITENTERVVPLETFFTGPGKTLLAREELMVEIQIPEPKGNTGSAFLKLGRVSADLAKINIAVVLVREGDLCRDCRIVLGAVAEKPLRMLTSENILKGKVFSKDLLEKTGERVSEEIRPITDIRSSLWYRRKVSKVLVRDAINLAWERAAS